METSWKEWECLSVSSLGGCLHAHLFAKAMGWAGWDSWQLCGAGHPSHETVACCWEEGSTHLKHRDMFPTSSSGAALPFSSFVCFSCSSLPQSKTQAQAALSSYTLPRDLCFLSLSSSKMHSPSLSVGLVTALKLLGRCMALSQKLISAIIKRITPSL